MSNFAMRSRDGYQGHLVTKCALRLAPLVFVRSGELRHAEWSEINLENAEWRIPGEKMKMRIMHIVPLSEQAIELLQEIRALTGDSKYVFPSIRSSRRPTSENTVLAALSSLENDLLVDLNLILKNGLKIGSTTIKSEVVIKM